MYFQQINLLSALIIKLEDCKDYRQRTEQPNMPILISIQFNNIMLGKYNQNLNTSTHLFTDTYLSSLDNNKDRQTYDKNVYKAIKQNDVSYLVDKNSEEKIETTEIYNEEKELSSIINEIRKKYDTTKIKTALIEKDISHLEEEKQQIIVQIEKMKQELAVTKNNHLSMENKHHQFQQSLEYLEYTRDIRLSMQERLKTDILFFKKRCFDENIKLIRLKTTLKQASQKDNSKKHMNSKCKLVLNTLTQTVKVRQIQRQQHLEQVETVLMRKYQNTQLKTSRQHQLQSSMIKALTERLPEQSFLLNKLYCQLFLRKILRNKMNYLMEEYRTVQSAFNTIKKETRIANSAQFIEDYLKKDQRYGELLQSIGKSQKKILEEKEIYQELTRDQETLQLQAGQIDELLENMQHKNANQNHLQQKLMTYNQEATKCKQLKIMLKRWATKSYAKLSVQQDKELSNAREETVINDLKSLKKLIQKTLKAILQNLAQKNNESQSSTAAKKQAAQTSINSQRLDLRTLTQTVLSKQDSKRNFRVRTMTQHEQGNYDPDRDYDDESEYNFLKFNRRLVKKNNAKTMRARIKTKPF